MIDYSDASFEEWVTRACSDEMTDLDIATLATWLAESGERLRFSDKSADLASTGGPGSLSTLWAPPALVACGLSVPKLGVPGRPAGGIDVLAQIPGFRLDLNEHQAAEVVDRCGYVHVLAGTQFAPADAAMFAYRQRHGSQAIPALAIASLLSKKLAMGVTTVGLEVRVAPHGNFGADLEEAKVNADRFVRVARHLGLNAVCFLTDGTLPQQPYIGRGEALLALQRIFETGAGSWVEHHVAACEGWTTFMSRAKRPSRLAIAHAFASNIIAQGGSVDGLEDLAARVAASHTRIVEAAGAGVVSYDLGRLRDAIIKFREPDAGRKFGDTAGLILLAAPGSIVRVGEPIISVRCPGDVWASLSEAVLAAVSLVTSEKPVAHPPLLGTLEVVGV